jgi:hypothetical protein
MYDAASRILDFAQWFHAHADGRLLRASDPEAFVRMAYIAKGALDRLFGTGNRHSQNLVALCEQVQELQERRQNEIFNVSLSYHQAARILRTAAYGRLGSSGHAPPSSAPVV